MSDFFIGIELTRHCNLRCTHCFRAGVDEFAEIPVDVLTKILEQARSYNHPHIALTGGEATLHSRFTEILQTIVEMGFTFHYVTNGFNYQKTFKTLFPLLDHPQWVGVSVSLDGATEETHDGIRGPGSYRRALATCAIAATHGKEVTAQMVVHRGNDTELDAMALLCSRLGLSRLHFAHMQPTPHSVAHGLLHSPEEQRKIEEKVCELAKTFTMPIHLSAGFYDESPLAHCRVFKHGGLNIDFRGRLTVCCQLSNLDGATDDRDVIADLSTTPLTKAHALLLEKYNSVLKHRLAQSETATPRPLDSFHCYSCQKYFGKLDWLQKHPENDWVKEDSDFHKGRKDELHD